jgi:hypothetical protein
MFTEHLEEIRAGVSTGDSSSARWRHHAAISTPGFFLNIGKR